MKLSILLAGSILTSAIVGNVYAQTCGAQPSCSSLGYTYTGSTSDCVNTPMKCPFNTSYFNCTKKADALSKLKADIIASLMPNYKNRQSRSCNTYYTASSDGYIFGHLEHTKDGSTGGFNIYIDDVNVRLTDRGTDYGEDVFLFPIRKGSSYRATTGYGGSCALAFVPLN